jgi:hypothetical protein
MHIDQHGLAFQGIQNPGRMIDLVASSRGMSRIYGPSVVISRSRRIFSSHGTEA